MTGESGWKVGVEFELLAPAGRSRADLARGIADACGGRVRRVFHPQSEFARLDDTPVFENLTLGFAVEDPDGRTIAQCLDDLTLVDDLDAAMAPREGWYRVLSDDLRLLGLVEVHCEAGTGHIEVLEPLAGLFGTAVEILEEGSVARVCDRRGATVAMAVPLPGERERPCELVTAPLSDDRDAFIRRYLEIASRLGFTVPAEAATHIHFDGTLLQSAPVLAAMVHVFGSYRADLRRLVGTNPRCRRLGDWPKSVYRTAASPDFGARDWAAAAGEMRAAEPRKYCDFNFVNLLGDQAEKQTFEVRILPGTMDADFALRSIRLFEALLRICVDHGDGLPPRLPDLMSFLGRAALSADDLSYWQMRWDTSGKRRRFGF